MRIYRSAATLVVAIFASTAIATPQYAFQQLPPLAGYQYVQPAAINDSGEIVGTSVSTGFQQLTVATKWINLSPSAVTAWGNPNISTVGTDINANGDILARGPQPYVYHNGQYHLLASVSYSDTYTATAINNSGLVIGYDTVLQTAVLWDSTGLNAIFPAQSLPNSDNGTRGVDINNAGEMLIHEPATNDTDYSSFIVDNQGTSSQLAPYGESLVMALNDNGLVVGVIREPGSVFAASWNDNVPLLLPGLSYYDSYALACNNSGLIVGESNDTATIWINGEVFDLNMLISNNPGLDLTQAVSINSSGQILAYSSNSGETFGYLLTPIPEPTMLILAFILPMFRRPLSKVRVD